ncbi:LmbE family N-acetylglucosaminyl deacetylase [Devosia sp. UYZn731]|uniref:PIG-L deacetylase family protein n=1 Tax=Devosia sp. UYZn731 TaxID=3156345 RepID=UPI003396D698
MQIDLNSYKTILVVSPHLDDGVLSVGGLIEKAAANGADVIVATAFTADTPPGMAISPLAIELHELWNLGSNPFEHRRNEDIAAVGALGGRTLHGPLLDALYRTDRDGNFLYPTRQSIFSQPPDHDDVGEALSHLLDQWIAEVSPDLVLTPLGVGRHADHIQTTNALRRLAKVRTMTVALYEDMPYATGVFPVAAPDTVDAALKRTLWQVAGSQIVPVDLAGKLNAIAAYASQIADIFPNGIEVGSVLDDYMRLGGPTGAYGERLWKAVP